MEDKSDLILVRNVKIAMNNAGLDEWLWMGYGIYNEKNM